MRRRCVDRCNFVQYRERVRVLPSPQGGSNDAPDPGTRGRSGLRSDIAAGITFVGYEVDGVVAGVMGIQPVRNVDLIRHAYVLPAYQGHGVGSALLTYLRAQTHRQILIGTWTAAIWAIRFYERHGFHLVPEATKALLLRTYWTVSERQIETSVVLAAPRLTSEEAGKLVERAEAGGRRAMYVAEQSVKPAKA